MSSASPAARPLYVIDYGVNNVGSVVNMLRRLSVDVRVAERPHELSEASGVILPGIGSFDAGVRNLQRRGFVEPLRELAERRVPLLGICLGMQLLTRGSEEGTLAGLSLLPATTQALSRLDGAASVKIPHMGWNATSCVDRTLFAGFDAEPPRFYYVHSYHVVCEREEHVAARCVHGGEFVAAVRAGTVFGTQFHPEKSHRFGMQLLSNFARFALDA